MSKCPKCGKYLSCVTALVNGFDEIIKVEGTCRKHGVVETNDWEYWDFYPGSENVQSYDLFYPPARP